jgi:hypothetical protein
MGVLSEIWNICTRHRLVHGLAKTNRQSKGELSAVLTTIPIFLGTLL